MESVLWFWLGGLVPNSDVLPSFPCRRRTIPIHPHRFCVASKKSSFHEFQEYVQPKRLLPASGLKSFRAESPDKLISTLLSDGSPCVYKLLLRTSSIYGSALSDDFTAHVLVCIIDEHGDSILAKIPAILPQHLVESQDIDHIHFRGGSADQFLLWGPKLARIQALWISLESGSWRLGGAGLTTLTLTISNHQAQECSLNGFTYNFEVEDVLLGEGGDTAMVELRPSQVTQCTGVDCFEFLGINGGQAPSAGERKRMNEESMGEYANLKYSQLVYDSMLTLVGTSFSAVTGGENTAVAFFTGGIGGFIYLLLLQRSVDKIPSPGSVVIGETSNFGKVKGPLQLGVFAFALGVAVVIRKHYGADVEIGLELAPEEMLVGMLGFLTSKLAVVLSALKPLSKSMQDNK